MPEQFTLSARMLMVEPTHARAYHDRAISRYHLGNYLMADADSGRSRALGFEP